jgi:subfamily B ATP-binding cassette protein MsbA
MIQFELYQSYPEKITMKNYTRFIRLILPHKGVFSLAVLCMLLASAFGASPIALIIPLVDKVISGKDILVPQGTALPAWIMAMVDKVNALPRLQLLNAMVIMVVIIFLLKGIFEFFKAYFMADVSQKVVRDVKNDIYKKLQELSMDFYSHNPTGQLMSRITHDASVIRDAISSGVTDTFAQPIELLFYLGLLITLKMYGGVPWSFILVSAVVFPFIMYPVIRMGKRLRKISQSSQEKIGDINNMLLETITGIKLVKSFGMEDYELNRFKDHNNDYYKLNMNAIRRMKIVSPLTESLMVMCVAVIMWIAGKSMITGEFSFGIFAAFLAAIFSMMKPLKKLSNVYGINQQALAAADRIFDLLDTPVSIQEKPDAISIESCKK